MLEEKFTEVYSKFKMHFYQEAFKRIESKETSLSTVETFCVEIIHALKNPTVNQFASFIQVSSPNATYKINSLIKKGYIRKVQSEKDKREFHLQVTDKFYDDYNLGQSYVKKVAERVDDKFSASEVKTVDHVLDIMSSELMPEVSLPVPEEVVGERKSI